MQLLTHNHFIGLVKDFSVRTKQTFIVEVVRQEGKPNGLHIEGYAPNGDVSNVGLLAHDMLEHLAGPNYIGSITDELMAIGAAYYTRGQFDGYCKPPGTEHLDPLKDILAIELNIMFDCWYQIGCPETGNYKLPDLINCGLEQEFAMACHSFFLRSDLYNVKRHSHFMKLAMRWMGKGVHLMNLLYERPVQGYILYRYLSECLTSVIRSNAEPVDVGTRYTFSVSYKTCKVAVKVIK